MMHYIWWIPTVIIYYSIFAYLSKINNDHSLINNITWYKDQSFWIMFFYGAFCPLWMIISRISKNILFDGMLYDNILFLAYAFTMIYFGSGSKFSTFQWIGFGLFIVGSILMRIETSHI